MIYTTLQSHIKAFRHHYFGRKMGHRAMTYLKPSHRKVLLLTNLAIASLIVGALYAIGSHIRTRVVPTGSVRLSTPYTTYLVGEEIRFVLQNDFNSSIRFANNCPEEPLAVYKQTNGSWVRQHDSAESKSCESEKKVITVPAHGTTTDTFAAWKKLFAEPGTYRIVAYIDYYDALASTDFTIITKPAVPSIPAIIPPKTVTVTRSTGTSRTATTSQSTPTPSSPTPTPASSTPTTHTQTLASSGGAINVSYTATTITLLSVNPTSPYTQYEANRTTGSSIEITFKRPGGGEYQVLLRIQNGQVVQTINP